MEVNISNLSIMYNIYNDNYLKEELGINIEHKKRKIPKTINEAVHEIEDLI